MNPKDQPVILGRSMRLTRLDENGCVDPDAPVITGPFEITMDFKVDPMAIHAYMRLILGEDTTWQYQNWNKLVAPRLTKWQDRWDKVVVARWKAWDRIRIAARILRYGP